MAQDTNDVGQGKQYEDYSDKLKSTEGEYQESPARTASDDQKFPLGPKAPDPSPFKLGPTGD